VLLCAVALAMPTDTPQSSATSALQFLRQRWLAFATITALLLIPCLWHRHIEAGDLGSHVYNAWLAQLIAKGQAPGLYLVNRWDNVLFDVMLLKLGNLFGLTAAEKIAVFVCVLVFFWGTFALMSTVAQRPAWFLVPCVAMLAYGWTFNVGFFNYYVSVGLGFFAIAMVWRAVINTGRTFSPLKSPQPLQERDESPAQMRGARSWRGREVLIGLVLAALVFVAHPQGFVWMVGCVGYIVLWRALPGWWKLAVPAAAVALIVAVRLYCARHYEIWMIGDVFGRGIYNGADQIRLYTRAYFALSLAAMLFGIICFLMESWRRQRQHQGWGALRLPFELYAIVVCATYVLPDSLRTPIYSGLIGGLAARLTTISAALGLCILALLKPRKWYAIGFTVVAAVFFGLLYRDTGVLNRMEQQIGTLVSTLPPRQRVLATILASPHSKVPFIVHMADRACIGKCFSYENYEPASGQFRVRVQDDSPAASPDVDDRQDMESGEYVVKPEDLPMWQIYQCDAQDMTRLCLRPLTAGEVNGRLSPHPVN
jgi:hypothetical protein